MNVAIQAHVYQEDGPRVVHLTVALSNWYDLEITPEEFNDLLEHSLLHDNDAAELPKLPLEALNAAAPQQVFKKALVCGDNDCSSCAVCLTEFRPRMHVRRLPCGHLFCSKCIQKWVLNHHAVCPSCRAALD